MGRIWSFIGQPKNRAVLAWLGGALVIAAGGAWTVVTHFWPAHEPPHPSAAATACASEGVAIGGSVSGSTISNTVSGSTSGSQPCAPAGGDKK